ncbi:multiple sugar transport system substrate-binding protein [Paenibacillus sp. UNCCL117]|uniref:extracellular solute-binding protein n=1 Tax=unclassified Paenibacillus TaxID=185978 RepID=UPI0008807ED4|nr:MULTISPECIES: extracellular solute-binding protein [unclassified Paenibacillus]SDC93300.1 multiple sugar transport system substrate-binding protein [Paenibacillus sp. cl123]SFW29528.1 multiple sugar transport system substrate-binding protein [Paenibacillus sp. UNCCL117]
MSNRPDRITFQSRLDDMITSLRREIKNAQRPAGEYLPSEMALADQYKLSKKSVRKGLDVLVAEGLIVKEHRVGNKIIGPKTAAPQLTLRLGYYPSLEGETDLRELLKQFGRLYPHVKVDTLPLPYTQYPESIREYLDNGWLDVISLNNWNFLETAQSGALDLFEPVKTDPQHYSFLSSVFAHEGMSYARPFIFSPVVLCYNKSLFRELSIPEPDSSWSWSDLADLSVRLKQEHDTIGFYAHIASTNRFPIVLLQNSFRFERQDSGYKYDDPRMWESLRSFRDLIYGQDLFPSFLSESDADAEKLFVSRKAAMLMTTYYSLRFLQDATFEYDLAPLPYQQNAKTLLLVTGLAISRQSPHKQAARQLVEFLTQEAAQLHIRQHTLSIPAHKPSAEWTGPEKGYRPARYHVYREIVPTYGRYEDLNLPIRELDHLRHELKLFWSNLEQAEDVAARLASGARISVY